MWEKALGLPLRGEGSWGLRSGGLSDDGDGYDKGKP